jgi:hypothetical protein
MLLSLVAVFISVVHPYLQKPEIGVFIVAVMMDFDTA